MKQMSKRPWNSIGKSVTYPHVFSPFQFLYPSASGVPYEMKWWWESKANCFLKLGKITSTTYHIITAFCSTWFTKQMTHYYFPQRNSLCYKSAFEAYFLWNICTRLKKNHSEMGNKGGKWIFLWFKTLLIFQISLPTVTNCATIFKTPQEGLVNLAPGPNLVCPFLLRKSDWNTTMPICLDLAYGRFHTYDDRVQ